MFSSMSRVRYKARKYERSHYSTPIFFLPYITQEAYNPHARSFRQYILHTFIRGYLTQSNRDSLLHLHARTLMLLYNLWRVPLDRIANVPNDIGQILLHGFEMDFMVSVTKCKRMERSLVYKNERVCELEGSYHVV